MSTPDSDLIDLEATQGAGSKIDCRYSDVELGMKTTDPGSTLKARTRNSGDCEKLT